MIYTVNVSDYLSGQMTRPQTKLAMVNWLSKFLFRRSDNLLLISTDFLAQRIEFTSCFVSLKPFPSIRFCYLYIFQKHIKLLKLTR